MKVIYSCKANIVTANFDITRLQHPFWKHYAILTRKGWGVPQLYSFRVSVGPFRFDAVSLSASSVLILMWEPASHRSGWFGRFRPLTKGGSLPSLNFESRCIKRCAPLTPRLPSRAAELSRRLARLKRRAAG